MEHIESIVRMLNLFVCYLSVGKKRKKIVKNKSIRRVKKKRRKNDTGVRVKKSSSLVTASNVDWQMINCAMKLYQFFLFHSYLPFHLKCLIESPASAISLISVDKLTSGNICNMRSKVTRRDKILAKPRDS